ncbi:acyl-CoA dehydratase activase-related protein, partial [Desulfonatronospira sp. MSAO_Bac3]|uniref:acyl-CoA dehydratase activase-related protein n=1 Tax=Desulfonatronospira sp. MSAO_Bac3 TaxID=2293857 RepID=UPI000FF84A4E
LEWGILWANIFSELGLNVLFSPATNHDIASTGVESMTAETCFPVKVFHGHVNHLQRSPADYLFLPNPINVPTPDEDGERGVLCPMVESSQYMATAALQLDESRLIRPTLFLKEGIESIAQNLYKALPPGLKFREKEVQRAVSLAWVRQMEFKKTMQQKGREIISGLDQTSPVWVVTGRPYNLYDERLNLRLGRQLAKLDITALPMDFVDFEQVNLHDFPRMYWGLGGRILRTAKLIAQKPNWFGVHLTNFSCGPDSFLEHFFGHILQQKPPLVLELDEHSAVAGVLTRIEAYKNVVQNILKENLVKKEKRTSLDQAVGQ